MFSLIFRIEVIHVVYAETRRVDSTRIGGSYAAVRLRAGEGGQRHLSARGTKQSRCRRFWRYTTRLFPFVQFAELHPASLLPSKLELNLFLSFASMRLEDGTYRFGGPSVDIQMVANIIVYLLLASLLYAYTNHNREFTATASAIRQIWSGTCRLSCRHSEYSGFSGLSGLVQRQSQGCGSIVSEQLKQVQTSINNQSVPSSTCVCETCPCAVLENVLRTCSPATNLYSELIQMLSNLYYEVVRAATDLYVYIDRVVNCGVSCQRPAQLTTLKLNSAENYNFANASSSRKVDTAKKIGKEILNLKPSAISFRRQSEDQLTQAELHTSTGAHNFSLNLARESLRPNSDSRESVQVSKSCSKCVEKGKVCMNNCPRSKEKK